MLVGHRTLLLAALSMALAARRPMTVLLQPQVWQHAGSVMTECRFTCTQLHKTDVCREAVRSALLPVQKQSCSMLLLLLLLMLPRKTSATS